MQEIGYFPGCSLSGTASEYDKSLRAVAGHMGIALREIPDWVCCGATSAHAVDHAASMCLAADTLAKARRSGLSNVLAPCAMCYQRLAVVAHEMRQHPEAAATLAEALGEPRDLGLDKVRPLSLLTWLAETPDDQIAPHVARPLQGLKVACYYGCLLVRPPAVTGASPAEVETPRLMERVVTLLGAQPVRWTMALECCGGAFAVARKEVVLRQGRRIYDAAQAAGADILCLACPMCHSNLDVRQAEFNATRAVPGMPVLYLTQLMGLAFGLNGPALGLKAHFVPVEPALNAALTRKQPA